MRDSREAITTQTITVSPEDALHLRKACLFPRQRPIAELNVRRLGLEMVKDRFVQGTPIFFCVLPDGTQFIVNGNHTLEAIAYSGKSQTLVFIFLKVANFAEAARVYGSFDLHKARTWVDALKAVGIDQEFVMPTKVLPAVGLIMQGFRYAPENVEAVTSRQSRFDAMKDYKEPAIMLQAAMAGAPRINHRLMTRTAVMAVALETIRYQPSAAIQFWQGVAQDDGLASGDARKTLLRWLMNHKAGGATANHLMSRACAHAWNVWMRGEGLVLLRPASNPRFVLAGTPWTANGRAGAADTYADEARKAATDTSESLLPDLFQTGVRITESGAEPVVMFKKTTGTTGN